MWEIILDFEEAFFYFHVRNLISQIIKVFGLRKP